MVSNPNSTESNIVSLIIVKTPDVKVNITKSKDKLQQRNYITVKMLNTSSYNSTKLLSFINQLIINNILKTSAQQRNAGKCLNPLQYKMP